MSDGGGVAPNDLAIDPGTGMAVAPNALLGLGSAWKAGLENTLAAINSPMFPGGTLDLSHPMLGFAGPGSIKGFHGTGAIFEPVEHNPFGEFRNEFIGTGEGAQAYGYGHYVAGNPKVAEDYQKTLANRTVLLDNSPIYSDSQGWIKSAPSNAADYAIHAFNENFGDVDKAVEHLQGMAKAIDPGSAAVNRYNNAADWLKNNGDRLSHEGSGALLEVHILPDEHELLDWDKPLSQQPEGVQQTIDKIHAGNENLRIMNAGSDVNGENFYRNLGGNLMVDKYDYDPDAAVRGTPHDQLASQALHEAGIPGIRYLDQGSRQPPDVNAIQARLAHETSVLQNTPETAYHYPQLQTIVSRLQNELETAKAWQPTHNYVIFDPSNLRIIARNGQRLEPVEHDPFQTEPKP